MLVGPGQLPSVSMRYDGTVHRYTYHSTQTHILRLQANQFAFTFKTKRLVLFVNFLSARRLLVGHAPVHSSTVAFYAYLGKSESSIGLHHSLIFDVVITNLGNGYNKHTGAFIAPQDGVYVLTLTIFPNRGTITSVHILRSNDVVGEIFGDMSSGPHLSGSTGVVVVTMNTGDAATIRTSSTFQSRGDLISDPNMKTSFAGWKLADIS